MFKKFEKQSSLFRSSQLPELVLQLIFCLVFGCSLVYVFYLNMLDKVSLYFGHHHFFLIVCMLVLKLEHLFF